MERKPHLWRLQERSQHVDDAHFLVTCVDPTLRNPSDSNGHIVSKTRKLAMDDTPMHTVAIGVQIMQAIVCASSNYIFVLLVTT